MPGTTMPEPSPFVHVTEQAQPSASSTEMCVVEPSRRGHEALEEAGLGEAREELRRALGLGALHRAARARATSGGPGARSSSASA